MSDSQEVAQESSVQHVFDHPLDSAGFRCSSLVNPEAPSPDGSLHDVGPLCCSTIPPREVEASSLEICGDGKIIRGKVNEGKTRMPRVKN